MNVLMLCTFLMLGFRISHYILVRQICKYIRKNKGISDILQNGGINEFFWRNGGISDFFGGMAGLAIFFGEIAGLAIFFGGIAG